MVESVGGGPAPVSSGGTLDFLNGGGALGDLIRSSDWSASPLGPPASWPPVLKSTVAMMLPAAQQIVLFWGPEFVALYNDSYAPTIGDKHPRALGRPARENWAELWDDLEPMLRRVLEHGETVAADDRPFTINRHGDPETVYFDISYSPVRDESGEIAGVLCLVKETTQKVLAEQRLRTSEQSFHAMADSVDQMIWAARPDGHHDYYNRRWYDYTGVPEGSTDGEGWNGMFHPEDQDRAWETWRRSLETGQPYQIEYRLRHRSDQYRWVLGRAQAVRDESGAITRWYGTCTDIHEFKVAQEQLRRNERRLRILNELDEALASSRDAPGAMYAAARVLAQRLETSRCAYAAVDADNDSFTIYQDYTAPGIASSAGSYSLELFGPRAADDMRAGRTLVVRDVAGELGAGQGRETFQAIGIGAIVCCPLLKEGRLAAMMAVHQDRPRDWSAEDIELIEATVEHCWAHVERVGAEARLRESEARFRNMADHAPVMMWVTDPSGYCTYLNRGWYEFTGQTAAEAEGFGWLDATHPDDKARTEAAFVDANAKRGPFRIEYRLRRHDGRYRWALDAAAPRFGPNGEFLGYVGSVIDIDERREIEDALRSGEDRLRLAINATQIGIWDFDPTSGRLDWDERVRASFGLSRDAHVDYDVFLAGLHPEDREASDAAVQRALEPGGAGTYDIEYRTVGLEDGKERWIAARGQAQFEDGRAVRFIGSTLDVSARKQVESALSRSESDLRGQAQTLETLNRTASQLSRELDQTKVVQMVTDNGVELTGAQFGAFFYNVLNEAGESYMLYALTGATSDQFDFGMPRNTEVFHATFSGEGVVRVPDITRDSRYGKMAPHFGMPKGHLPVRSYLAVPVVSASGEVIGGLFFGHGEPDCFSERHEALMTGIAAQAAIAMDNARLYQAAQSELASRMRAEQELRLLNETLEHRVADEVERRTQAEDALRQAQKMETLGQLTGGVAHDFNNLLQIVSGNIGLIQRGLPTENAKLRRAADNAARGAERAAVLTQRLLAFSRRQPLAPKPIDPNRLVGGMSELLHRTLGETIAVETVLSSGLWPIEADPHQLENAILNLAINGRDAMPDGGKLTIETCNTHLDRAYTAANAEVVPGQYVCICVTDSGTGMDEDTVARAFEPFFTTKEVGKGTGLGLSMVYGFVKQSGGHLKIYSEPGEGTTVKIYLPRLLGARLETEAEAEELIPEGGSNETILVCEDDDDVRAYTVEVLRELGYRVLEAGDGPAALRILERQDERIDLLFTDVVLPSGMTGAVLAQQAQRLRPGLKVLFTTGYARNAIVHHGRLDAGVELITKPFSYADLAARVRDMMDGQA